jgi:hypothetical protein
MKSDSFQKMGNYVTKASRGADWIFSKIFGLIFLLGGIFFFAGVLYTGAAEVYQQITWPSTSATIDSMESNTSGSEMTLFLSLTEKDGNLRPARMNYSVDQSIESDEYILPYYLYEGATITVLYQENNPSQLIIAQPVWGFFMVLILPVIFMFVGYLQLSTQASKRFNRWNSDWRLWWAILVLGGLACFIMAYFVDEPAPESVIQSTWVVRLILIGMGLPLFFIGGYKLVHIIRQKREVNNLLTSGTKIEFTDFSTEADKLHVGDDSSDHKKAEVYIIKCVHREAGQALPFVYTSNPILFDPSPYLPDKIIVYVNPTDKYKYYMDVSFLPATSV